LAEGFVDHRTPVLPWLGVDRGRSDGTYRAQGPRRAHGKARADDDRKQLRRRRNGPAGGLGGRGPLRVLSSRLHSVQGIR